MDDIRSDGVQMRQWIVLTQKLKKFALKTSKFYIEQGEYPMLLKHGTPLY